MRFDEHFIRGVISESSLVSNTFPKEPVFSIDSRTLKKGDIFIALEGKKFDGHTVISEVLKAGAAGVFLSSKKKKILDEIDAKLLKNRLIVLVPDTLDALVKLASAWRAQFTSPVVAITGSIGKTSTKEMMANILQLHGMQHTISYGNQNTKIGLCLNILHMKASDEVAVFELGISRRGEMAELVTILKPTTALITTVGHSHMEGLGSLADIASEKRQVFKYFTEESIGIINGDLPILSDVGYDHPVIKFGSKTTNQVQARKIHISNGHISFVLKIYQEKYNVLLRNTHVGAVYNAIGAAVIGHILGIGHEIIVKGIEVPVIVSSRFEKLAIKNKRGVLINDCYNASPESMKAALLALEHIDTDAKKIAVLGDMLELGVNSPFWHRQLGRILRKASSLKHVILVGDMVSWTKKTIPIGVAVEHVPDWKTAVKMLEDMIDRESVVLVKASSDMKLSNLVTHFAEK